MAKEIVAGEMYESITGQLFEIGRQLRQPNGYPFDPKMLKDYLQDAIEGRFRLSNFLRETGGSASSWVGISGKFHNKRSG